MVMHVSQVTTLFNVLRVMAVLAPSPNTHRPKVCLSRFFHANLIHSYILKEFVGRNHRYIALLLFVFSHNPQREVNLTYQ